MLTTPCNNKKQKYSSVDMQTGPNTSPPDVKNEDKRKQMGWPPPQGKEEKEEYLWCLGIGGSSVPSCLSYFSLVHGEPKKHSSMRMCECAHTMLAELNTKQFLQLF